MPIKLWRADERPDLLAGAEALTAASYPPFMLHDPVSARYWEALYTAPLARFQTIAELDGQVIAQGNAIPFMWRAGEELPNDGWDAVLEAGVEATRAGLETNALSALSIVIAPNHRGAGLAEQMLGAMKQAANHAGLTALVAPVRPTRKADYPLQDFERYCGWTRGDGTPFDPWIRTHWRLGASIVKTAPCSMRIPGNISAWQQWTGLTFPESGLYGFAGGLAPLVVDIDRDEAVYTEPNLWMRHLL
ncbi:MAG TPA: GNAT family N-acetyltransferase [Devosiaceae bacterium]